jgi:hypothetical protein
MAKDRPIPVFSRAQISGARDHALAGNGDHYYILECPPMPSGYPKTPKICIDDAYFRRWTASQVLAHDGAALEAAGEALCRALALQEALLDVCPICGGSPINLGPLVIITLTHTKDCPLLKARKAMIRILEGEEAAEKLARIVVIKDPKP